MTKCRTRQTGGAVGVTPTKLPWLVKMTTLSWICGASWFVRWKMAVGMSWSCDDSVAGLWSFCLMLCVILLYAVCHSTACCVSFCCMLFVILQHAVCHSAVCCLSFYSMLWLFCRVLHPCCGYAVARWGHAVDLLGICCGALGACCGSAAVGVGGLPKLLGCLLLCRRGSISK